MTGASDSSKVKVHLFTNATDALTTNYAESPTGVLTNGSWTHISAVYDGALAASDRIKIYINGQPVATTITGTINATGAASGAANARMGNASDFDQGTTSDYNGVLDEVKVYISALTADQIKTEFNQGVSQVMGAVSTDSSGNSTWSSDREYCIPGDTSSCNAPFWEIKFDEKSGTTFNDTSGNDRAAAWVTEEGSPTIGFKTGKKGSSFFQSGDTSNFGFVRTNSTFSPPTLITMEAWVHPTATNSNSTHFITNMDTGGYILGLTGSSSPLSIRFRAIWSTNGSWFVDNVVPLNQWSHIAVTYDTTNVSNDPSIYLNGVLQTISSETQPTGTWTNTTDNLLIFDDSNGASDVPFLGLIDHVVWYNYIRTPAQIAWDYSQGEPVAHYKFDECSGTTAYNSVKNGNGQAAGMNGTITPGGSGNTAAGSCNSGTSTEMWHNGTTGKFNSSLDFDGTDDYVEIADNDSFSFGDGTTDRPFTLSAWIKTSDSGGKIIAKYDSSAINIEYFLRIGAANTLQFRLADDSNTSTIGRTGPLTLSGSEWNHIVATYDGTAASSGMAIYANGKRIDNADDNAGTYASMENTSAALLVGYNTGDDATQYFDGQIDDVRIYNYALTVDQIQTLYNGGAAVRF